MHHFVPEKSLNQFHASGRGGPISGHHERFEGSLNRPEKSAIKQRGARALMPRNSIVKRDTTHGNNMKPQEMFHALMGMNQHRWELHREVASQAGGHLPGIFWPKMSGGVIPSKALNEISGMNTPHAAARKLVLKTNMEGCNGPYCKSMSQVIGASKHHLRRLTS